MTDRPFWSDRFDLDLPAVVPGAREAVGDLADIELWTTGGVTDGALNHPSVWNSYGGMLAFFGFGNPCRPAVYSTSAPIVRCSLWEAVRDAWCHDLVMLVEGVGIWDTGRLTPHRHTILREVRGWSVANADEAAQARRITLASLTDAVDRFRRLIPLHEDRVRRFSPQTVTAPPSAILSPRPEGPRP